MITKGYYNNEHLLKHQTYCPQLVAEQTFFSDFTIQSYSWIRMHQSAYDFFYPSLIPQHYYKYNFLST